jgi:rhodanese-related sulfurtransferase
MITIHPMRIAMLVDKHRPFDLIDVRTEQEFRSFHIRGAQSFPLRELSGPKLLRERKLPARQPLFIISSNRVRASLAAGILNGAGCLQPIVVDGGMDAWMSRGLPVVWKRLSWNAAVTAFCRRLIGLTRGPWSRDFRIQRRLVVNPPGLQPSLS